MAAQSLGKISVTPGTPVRITNNQASPTTHLACGSIMIQTLSSSTGFVYIGLSNLDKSSGTGVLAVLPVPTTNSIPAFSLGNPTAQAGINANELFIDGASTSDGVIASIMR
jgi:hypothetical protein